MSDFEVLCGAIDAPDDRDYSDSEVFGASEELPEKVLHETAPIYNQGRTMYCTAFSAAKWMNETNGEERKKIGVPFEETIAPLALAHLWLESGDLSEKLGGTIQWPLNMLLKRGDIEGYTKTDPTVIAMKSALVGNLLCTGSNTIDWKLLRTTSYIVTLKSKGSGHAFCIVGYDDNFVTPFGKGAFIVANSYGPEYGRDGGYFYVPYEMIGVFYSRYRLIDVSNASPLYRHKAKLAGIWNGERENESVTRYEAATMCQRVRPNFSGNIWNEQDRDMPVIRQDFITMLSRVIEKQVEWSGERPMDNLTRGEAAELCGKYL